MKEHKQNSQSPKVKHMTFIKAGHNKVIVKTIQDYRTEKAVAIYTFLETICNY